MGSSVTTDTQTIQAASVIERYVAAYNSHDSDALADVHHKDVKLLDGDEVRVEGRDNLMQLVFKNQFANNGRIEILSRTFAGSWVIDQQIMYGTARGDLRICAAYRVRGGLIDLAIYLDPEA